MKILLRCGKKLEIKQENEEVAVFYFKIFLEKNILLDVFEEMKKIFYKSNIKDKLMIYLKID